MFLKLFYVLVIHVLAMSMALVWFLVNWSRYWGWVPLSCLCSLRYWYFDLVSPVFSMVLVMLVLSLFSISFDRFVFLGSVGCLCPVLSFLLFRWFFGSMISGYRHWFLQSCVGGWNLLVVVYPSFYYSFLFLFFHLNL